MLATVARARDDRIESETCLQPCLQLAPGYAAARFELATELCGQQRYDEAKPHIERLLASEPRDPGYLDLKIQAMRFYGQHDAANALLQQLMADHPDDAVLRLFHGHLLREIGDQAGAISGLPPGTVDATWNERSLVEPG